jgi:hypothetical protein
MKPIRALLHQPAGVPLVADDVLEFHAARLLLLFRLCGVRGRIDGLTKMAKLDFFVRYPHFFARALRRAGGQSPASSVESPMVRHHYGPWDKRYYHLLAYLESTGLILVSKDGNQYRLSLTEDGDARARVLEETAEFASLCSHMRDVKREFGRRSGSSLKGLIYQVFADEIAARPIGEMID